MFYRGAGLLKKSFSDIIGLVSDDRQQRSKAPELKVVEESKEIHRLEENSAPPRKKAHFRRSQEEYAIARDLARETQNEIESLSPPLEASNTTPDFEKELPPHQPLIIPPVVVFIFIIGFLALLGVGLYLATNESGRSSNKQLQEQVQASRETSEKERQEARALLASLSEVIQNYTSAQTVAEKFAYSRQTETTEERMQEWYQTHDLKPMTGAKIFSQYTLPIENHSFTVVTASFNEVSSKIFLVEVNNDLSVRVDWESDVCYQPVQIAEYIETKPKAPVSLRVFAKPDNFYLYEFSDSDKYQCLCLNFRDSEEILYGYIERGTPHSRRLGEHFNKTQKMSQKPAPLILTVKFLPDSRSERGVLITDFVAPRWANIEDFSDHE